MARYHLSADGAPRSCRAEPGNCPLGKDLPHYSSRKEAAEAYEQLMAPSSVVTVSSSTRKLSKELSQLFGEAKASEIPLEKLRHAGSLVESELLARVGIEDFPEKPSKEERDLYSQELSKLLKELDTRGEKLTAEFHGPLAKELRTALEVIPASAAARVTNDVYTKKIPLNNQQHDGFHVAQAEVLSQAEPTHKSASSLGKQQVGDYILGGSDYMTPDELNDESYTGFAVNKLVRAPQPLRAGESALDYTKLAYRPEKLIIELINDGVLDGSGRLVAGREAEFEKRAPEWAQAIASTYSVTSFFAGKAPTGKAAAGNKYVKVAESFTVTDNDGQTHEVRRPIYEVQEKTISYTAHTVAAKVYPHGVSHSVLLHEFTHAIQSQKGGIPGEVELFQELQLSKPIIIKSDKYTHYANMPDDYMASTSGRELFTRTTEALFYGGNADNDFLYKAGDIEKGFRHWGMGAWAALTTQKG